MHIALAGHLASGKTSFAAALARAYGGRIASFGAYVRELTATAGLDSTDRSNLQNLGQRLVLSEPTAFFSNFLSRYGLDTERELILDGVRHYAIWLAIRTHAQALGIPSHLIFLRTDEATRRARLASRGNDLTIISKWDTHAMEKDLSSLLSTATIVLDGTTSIEDNLRKFQAAVAESSD